MLSTKSNLTAGAFTGGLAVGLGAFGAHALKSTLILNESTDTYVLATQYQMYHALALLLTGLLIAQRPQSARILGWAGTCFVAGILMFSGSLYILALTGSRSVVLITPLGGLFFLTGWALLAGGILKNKS